MIYFKDDHYRLENQSRNLPEGELDELLCYKEIYYIVCEFFISAFTYRYIPTLQQILISNLQGNLSSYDTYSRIIIKSFKLVNCLLCSLAQGFQSLSDFTTHLAASVDIVFPVIHGRFGEDGGIQV